MVIIHKCYKSYINVGEIGMLVLIWGNKFMLYIHKVEAVVLNF